MAPHGSPVCNAPFCSKTKGNFTAPTIETFLLMLLIRKPQHWKTWWDIKPWILSVKQTIFCYKKLVFLPKVTISLQAIIERNKRRQSTRHGGLITTKSNFSTEALHCLRSWSSVQNVQRRHLGGAEITEQGVPNWQQSHNPAHANHVICPWLLLLIMELGAWGSQPPGLLYTGICSPMPGKIWVPEVRICNWINFHIVPVTK